MDAPERPSQQDLESAQQGFDHLFSNELEEAKAHLRGNDSPVHLLGLGVCTFLQAALGMEKELMTEASKLLTLSETASRKMKATAQGLPGQRFPAGLEYEVLNADAVVLLGLTSALSESYMGYLNCIAHSKFTKLYKTVYPNGFSGMHTPADTPVSTPALSLKGSSGALRKAVMTMTPHDEKSPSSSKSSGGGSSFFSRWSSPSSSSPSLSTSSGSSTPPTPIPDGPVEELVMSGTAFGFGLFNLVFSLLPKKVQSVVGFLGYKHDRRLALRALAVSAAKQDIHSVFAGLVLMSYHGVVLLFTGYQADEAHILKQYRAIVDSIDSRYPDGALWILHKAKILRMTYDLEGATSILENGLRPGRAHTFLQADTLLAFELAWTYLSQRKYQQAAETFLQLVQLNKWSHATYYYLAAGCYVSCGHLERAQELYDQIPQLMDKRRFNGKELPTEVFIRKHLEFYKAKQKALNGTEAKYVEAIKLSPADELAIFWNTHTRIAKDIAQTHVDELHKIDLSSPEEVASRSLLLGILHRTLGNYEQSQNYLDEAYSMQNQLKVNSWVPGVALFESAVCSLLQLDSTVRVPVNPSEVQQWVEVLKVAESKLDKALSISQDVDLASRLDARVAIQRDEIIRKREAIGTK